MIKKYIFNSEMGIKELQDDFIESFDGMLFFISEIRSKKICGSMPSDLWDFIIKTNRGIDDFENTEDQNYNNKMIEELNQKRDIIKKLSNEIYNKNEYIKNLFLKLEESREIYESNKKNLESWKGY